MPDKEVRDNPAGESTPATGRVAEAEVCDDFSCRVGNLLVRGTHIEFVSTEQVRRYGRHKLDPVRMPSDVRIPRSHVLVHDTTGRLLDACDFYVVRWRGARGARRGHVTAPNDPAIIDAENYFVDEGGQPVDIRSGSVEIPDGPWHRVAQVKFIRYRRAGFAKAFEHEYDVPVDLLDTNRPLAWRLPLPTGCVVDERGFVRP